MKQFLFLSYGFAPPTPQVMETWGKWFASLGDRIVDQKGLGPGKELSGNGTADLSPRAGGATGYIVFNAEDLAEAEKLARGCPVIASNVIQEIMSMDGGD